MKVFTLLRRFCGYRVHDYKCIRELCACVPRGERAVFDTTHMVRCTEKACFPLAIYRRAESVERRRTVRPKRAVQQAKGVIRSCEPCAYCVHGPLQSCVKSCKVKEWGIAFEGRELTPVG